MSEKLFPAPLDEKNVMTDWIEEIFDHCDFVYNGTNMYTGFVKGSVCACYYVHHLLFWEISKNFQKDAVESYEELIRRLKERDTPPLVVEYDMSMRSELILCQKFYH